MKQAIEYVTAMRIELERQDLRKKNGDAVRQLELACIFTLCGMKSEHKFLAYKSAFTLNYKAGNFITASHFARQVIDLESTGVSIWLKVISLPRLLFIIVALLLLFFVLTIVAFE